MRYGDTLDVVLVDYQKDLAELVKTGLILGDSIDWTITYSKMFEPVFVVNSDNFLDVEYRFFLDNNIYNLDETRIILNKLNK